MHALQKVKSSNDVRQVRNKRVTCQILRILKRQQKHVQNLFQQTEAASNAVELNTGADLGLAISSSSIKHLLDTDEASISKVKSEREIRQFRQVQDRIMAIEKPRNKTLGMLREKYGEKIGDYIHYTKQAVLQFEAELQEQNPELALVQSKTWINSGFPFLSATPDALIVHQQSGKIVATVEYKTHSANNRLGYRHDHQIFGHLAVLGVNTGILVSLLKEPTAKIKFRKISKSFAAREATWMAQKEVVYSNLPAETKNTMTKEDLLRFIDRTMVGYGLEKPKEPYSAEFLTKQIMKREKPKR